jgi:glycosyltransferase involved in cell wall biosynthesis
VGCSVVDAPSCAVLIPAYNEASTVEAVIRVAIAADVGPVVVIDDGSSDDTAAVAERAGAELLRLDENQGKGGALEAGARSRSEGVLVLLDADLTGLLPEHVRELAEPVRSGLADMTRGVFVGGRWATTAAQRLAPQLAGQRGVIRHRLLEVPGLATSRYGVEVAITDHAQRSEWRSIEVLLPGVSQITKEEKRGLVRGLFIRLRMYLEIVRQVVRGRRDDDSPGSPGGA